MCYLALYQNVAHIMYFLDSADLDIDSASMMPRCQL